MGAFREGRDRRKREQISTMRDRLDYANQLRNLPTSNDLVQDSRGLLGRLVDKIRGTGGTPEVPEMNVTEVSAMPPSLDQTEVLSNVQGAMQQTPSEPPKIESITGEGNTNTPSAIANIRRIGQDAQERLQNTPPQENLPPQSEATPTPEKLREEPPKPKPEPPKEQQPEPPKPEPPKSEPPKPEPPKPEPPKPEPPKPEPPKPDSKPKEEKDKDQKAHDAVIDQMTRPKTPKEEKQRPKEPAVASETSEENKKTLARAMKDKVKPKKTSKEPEAKKKDESSSSNKNNALARAMKLKQKREKKAKEEKPATKEESKVPKLGSNPKDEDVLKVIQMIRDGNALAKTELYNALGDLEDNKSPHYDDALEAISDFNATMSKKTPKKEEKKAPPKKEESLNTELKEGAKKLSADEKVANLLGTQKKK